MENRHVHNGSLALLTNDRDNIPYNECMENVSNEYDPRYLAGILFFNQGDYFEAHEVWEDLWGGTPGPGRRFYQGLIQAAVALYHFGNGNVRGALKLYRTGRAYMEQFPSPHAGLDRIAFWQQMERCFAPLLNQPEPVKPVELDAAQAPRIVLNPPPSAWPDPSEFVEPREDS